MVQDISQCNSLTECEEKRRNISRKIFKTELNTDEMDQLLAEKLNWEEEIMRLGGIHRTGSRYMALRYSRPFDNRYHDEPIPNRVDRLRQSYRPILRPSKTSESNLFLPSGKKSRIEAHDPNHMDQSEKWECPISCVNIQCKQWKVTQWWNKLLTIIKTK